MRMEAAKHKGTSGDDRAAALRIELARRIGSRMLEDGVVATVKLPFRLRSGTHTNWFPQSVLPPVRDELS